MAARYTIIAEAQTVKVLSQVQSVNVQKVTILTKPSGIYTVVLVPLVAWQDGREADYLNPPAELCEQLLAGGLVTQETYVQSTDAAELLAGFMQMTVSYTPKNGIELPLTTKVLVPTSALASTEAFNAYSTSDNGNDPILVAYQRLVANAAA